MSKREFRRLVQKRPDKLTRQGWTYKQEDRGEVRVMARAEGYAMVRFKGGMPFVVEDKELQP